MNLSVLIVDKDVSSRDELSQWLQAEGHATELCGTLAEAAARLELAAFDCVLLDRSLPDGDGLDCALDRDWCALSDIVIVAGKASIDSAIQAVRRGVTDYLTKPLDTDHLRATLAMLAQRRALEREVAAARAKSDGSGRFDRLVGRSEPMLALFDHISRVAPTNASVLLVGESGTGKELVAAAIRELSLRPSAPLVAVNCGAIPEALIESELFGHEKGSFTGADRQRKGVFERSNGGTLFLDEVTEMPVQLQVKLLRVLETGRVTPIGSSRSIDVDVRVIAATNRNPLQAIDEGRLREDLYYRLAVFPIELPPLRQRPGDVALLAEHFLSELNREHATAKVWAPGSLDRLETRIWTGNVRELRNVVQRAFILHDQELQVPTDCIAATVASTTTAPSADTVPMPANWQNLTLKQLRDALVARAEERYLRLVLEQQGGRLDMTAATVGIGTRALYDAMQRHGLRKEDFRPRVDRRRATG